MILRLCLMALISGLFIGCESELTVVGGEGSGVYSIGDKVAIKANLAEEGSSFYKWNSASEGYIDNSFASSTEIKLMRKTVEVASEYISLDEKISLEVKSGSGSGEYTPGTVISIEADGPPAADQRFFKWIGDILLLKNINGTVQEFRVYRDDIYLEATYEKSYSVKVEAGSGSGDYFANDYITIKADQPPLGYYFKEWTGSVNTLSDPTNGTQSFRMPSDDLSFKATYDVVPKYELKVESGAGSGTYYEGDEVVIFAPATLNGDNFSKWEGGSGAIQDESASSTTLIMPANSLSVKATYSSYSSVKTCGESQCFLWKPFSDGRCTLAILLDHKYRDCDVYVDGEKNQNYGDYEISCGTGHVSIRRFKYSGDHYCKGKEKCYAEVHCNGYTDAIEIEDPARRCEAPIFQRPDLPDRPPECGG